MKRQWDVSYICNILWVETIRIPRAEECRPPGGANNRQWRSQDLEVGGTPIVCGTEVPQRGPGAHWWGVRGTKPPPPKAHNILRIFGCQTMLNFVYLAKLHEPLVKYEKNLGYSACLLAELLGN